MAAPQVIEENKQLLKTKYDSAKSLGAAVNDSKVGRTSGHQERLHEPVCRWSAGPLGLTRGVAQGPESSKPHLR